MDTEKIRNLVKKHLSEKPRNTVEIKHWLSENIDLNDNYDLAAILESDPSIIRIGRVRKSGLVGKESPLSEWATDKWVLHHEREQPKKMEMSKYENNQIETEDKEISRYKRRGKYNRNTRTRKLNYEAWYNASTIG